MVIITGAPGRGWSRGLLWRPRPPGPEVTRGQGRRPGRPCLQPPGSEAGTDWRGQESAGKRSDMRMRRVIMSNLMSEAESGASRVLPSAIAVNFS